MSFSRDSNLRESLHSRGSGDRITRVFFYISAKKTPRIYSSKENYSSWIMKKC